MSLTHVLSQGRAAANALMTETVRAGDYRDTTDEDTGDPVRVPVTRLYEGPARIKYTGNAASISETAGAVVTSQDIVISIPTQPASLSPGDVVSPDPELSPAANVKLPEGTVIEVLSSATDPGLVGRTYTVKGAPEMGQTTAHRYSVVELS